MLSYLIDAFNLFHKIPALKTGRGPKTSGKDHGDDRGLDSSTMRDITKELEKEWGVK